MSEEPDIVDELRKAERIGHFHKCTQEYYDINNSEEINKIVKQLFESNDEIDNIWFSLWRML